MEQSRPSDLTPILDAASDFATYPGSQTDASAKQFLDRFPLPSIFSLLQTEADVPGLEATLVACLDRIFRTRYGASVLLQYLAFLKAGLLANSQTVKRLACKAVSYILESSNDRGVAVRNLVANDIYPLLVECLIKGNEETSAASLGAIKSIAQCSEGISVILSPTSEGSIQLNDVAAHSSSLGRIRILALIKELFSLSTSVASAVYNANLLKLFEAEIYGSGDILTTLSAMEILFELVESPHSSSFLLKTALLQQLTDTISSPSADSVLRSRAISMSGRLLSSSDAYKDLDESRVTSLLMAIGGRLKLLESLDANECENALEALGQIGSSNEGASLLLTSSTLVARHVFESAFGRGGRGKQLAALGALGDICGANRPEDRVLLTANAEESLRRLFYTTAASTSKLTPSGMLLSVLQQEPDIRLAAYRLISTLVVRPWCLKEVCSKQDIVNIVTDANIEGTKNGMDARFNCCTAINKALSSSNMLNDATIAESVAKLQEAVSRGPYLVKRRIEAQPLVVTADRF